MTTQPGTHEWARPKGKPEKLRRKVQKLREGETTILVAPVGTVSIAVQETPTGDCFLVRVVGGEAILCEDGITVLFRPKSNSTENEDRAIEAIAAE